MIRSMACLMFLYLVIALPTMSAGADPLTAHDLVTMKRLSDPRVSPDGSGIAFVLRTTDLEADKGRTDLWWVPVAGGAMKQLTSHPSGDHTPRWSADGKSLWFMSSRSGSSQVWRLPMAGGEAQQVTDLPLDVGTFVVSPAGDSLAVTLDVYVDCSDLKCTTDRLAAEQEKKTSGKLYDQLFVRHWDTWKDGRRSRLFTYWLDGGATVLISKGLDADVPAKPFGGPEEITFSADGSELVFAARNVGKKEPWSTNFDLFKAPADGSAAPINLTAGNEAWDTQPVFSPDGKTLAYLSMARAGYEADRFRVVLMDWHKGSRRTLTESWDRSVGSLSFSLDGGSLYATAGDVGNVGLFRIDATSGQVETVYRDGHVRSPSITKDGTLIFARDDLDQPVDLFAWPPGTDQPKQITQVNEQSLAAISMGEFEQFSFPGWNNEKVYGYVIKPANFESGKSYPVAFLIHGGPQGSFDNDFHYRWNPQVYAGAGYGAVMIDFHGSTGYGQAFTDSIRGDWGGKPLEDLQKGLAAALAKYDWLDGERVCALGASYGGYMINWIAGNWPERFRCLVNHDGIFDTRQMYYQTEELWFPEWENSGTPWQNPEAYDRHNPANHVDKWQTPMLVVHGAKDYRVVDTQGLAAFTALQRQGIESQLLYYPDENHWVLKPNNSIQWHEVVLAWLSRHTGTTANPADVP